MQTLTLNYSFLLADELHFHISALSAISAVKRHSAPPVWRPRKSRLKLPICFQFNRLPRRVIRVIRGYMPFLPFSPSGKIPPSIAKFAAAAAPGLDGFAPANRPDSPGRTGSRRG